MTYTPAQLPPPVQVVDAIADLPEGATGYMRPFGFLVDLEGCVWVEGCRGYLPEPFDVYRVPIRRIDGRVVASSMPSRPMAWDNMPWAIENLRAERLYILTDPAQDNPPPKRRRQRWFSRWRSHG